MAPSKQVGQTTVEYMLILAIVFSLFSLVAREILIPAMEGMSERAGSIIERMFTRGLHRFPIRP